MKKDEKEKANERKVSPAPIRLSRPKTAPIKSKKVPHFYHQNYSTTYIVCKSLRLAVLDQDRFVGIQL